MTDDLRRCSKCGVRQPLSEFRWNVPLDCWQSWCKECEREWKRQYDRAHREEALERNRLWREANRERFNERSRQWQAQPERQEQRREYRAAVRARVLEHYGTACACCGTTDRLTIDHVNGDGSTHRQELFGRQKIGSYPFYLWLVREGFPDGYQVLCLPCNQSKSQGKQCRLWHGDPAFKRCTDCDQVKALDDFHRNATNRSGRAGCCKSCMARRYLNAR